MYETHARRAIGLFDEIVSVGIFSYVNRRFRFDISIDIATLLVIKKKNNNNNKLIYGYLCTAARRKSPVCLVRRFRILRND